MNIPEREVEAIERSSCNIFYQFAVQGKGFKDFTFLFHVVQRHGSKYGLHLQIKPVEKRRKRRRRREGEEEEEGEYMYIH